MDNSQLETVLFLSRVHGPAPNTLHESVRHSPEPDATRCYFTSTVTWMILPVKALAFC
jgi:hypothetical protein